MVNKDEYITIETKTRRIKHAGNRHRCSYQVLYRLYNFLQDLLNVSLFNQIAVASALLRHDLIDKRTLINLF